jgi:dTDP-4-dehydrorhamnose 3,5-epimerase-like enzyme
MMNNFQPNSQNQISERIYKTRIDGLYYVAHSIHPDDRGSFAELSLIPDLEKVIGFSFVTKQVNLALSKQNVCRGFHAEGWNKLVTVISGTGFSALADIRPHSSTYKQTETFVLGEDTGALKGCLFITKGIANSFCAMKSVVHYLYLVDRLYRDKDKTDEGAISLFDPQLNVDWPIQKSQMIISDRDKNAQAL